MEKKRRKNSEERRIHRQSLSRRYYDNYREEIKLKAKIWRRQHPEYTKEYTKKNKERKRDYHRMWRERKKRQMEEHIANMETVTSSNSPLRPSSIDDWDKPFDIDGDADFVVELENLVNLYPDHN